MNKHSIAAHIPTYNCPDLLLKCLENILWVDEIIIADNSSNESVKEVISKVSHKKIKYFKCEERDIRIRLINLNIHTDSEYILWVHTDEIYYKRTANEISSILEKVDPKDGYMVPSDSYIYVKKVGKGDDQIRLFKKDKYYFEMKSMHDMPKVHGTVGELKNGYAHFNSETLSSQVEKMFLYAANDSKLLNDTELKHKRVDNYTSFQIKKHFLFFILRVVWRSRTFFLKKVSFVDMWLKYLDVLTLVANDCNPTEEIRRREDVKYE